MSEFKPFQQIPKWDPNAKLTITGREFSILQAYFAKYVDQVKVMESIFARGLNEGKIQMEYKDTEGNPMTLKEVEQQVAMFNDKVEKGEI